MDNEVIAPPYPLNTVYREFLGIAGLVPYLNTVSASRHQMFTAQLGQTLEIAGAEPPFQKTGNEIDTCYGMTTFDITMPHTGRIEHILALYPKFGREINPLQTVIYQTTEGKIDCFNVTKFGSMHQHFGFDYVKGKAAHRLRPYEHIEAGSIFYHPRAKHQLTGEYMFGLNLNVCFASIPGVAEDGVIISRSASKKLRFKTYETRDVSWGSSTYPVMLYKRRNREGIEVPCPFPGLGQTVRSDGLLMATRPLDPYYGLNELNYNDITAVNHQFDTRTYAAGPGGKVVDIRVHHTGKAGSNRTPEGMDEQAMEYYQSRRDMMTSVYDIYKNYLRNRVPVAAMTHNFTQLVKEAVQVLGPAKINSPQLKDEPIKYTYRNEPTDVWRVEFVIEYERDAYEGCKVSDIMGGKGVIVDIWPDECMPTDAAGNRAEAIMCGDATVNRMNPGRLYEHFLNGASRDVMKTVVNNLAAKGLNFTNTNYEEQLYALDRQNGVAQAQWEMLAQFYSLASDFGRQWVERGKINHVDHLAYLLRNKIRARADGVVEVLPLDIYRPPEDQSFLPDMVEAIKQFFPQTSGPVTYTAPNGKTFVTHDDIRIAPIYIMFLEKIADSGAAISSAKLQHHGLLSKIPASERYSSPFRETAIRLSGEAEFRIFLACVGPRISAEIMDRNSNHATHVHMFENILKADKPTNIDNAVDRMVIPFGGSRALQILNHIAEIGGYKYVYKPMKDWWDRSNAA